jgi:hypothetical protein
MLSGKIILALFLVVLCAAFTGCIQSNQKIVVDEEGMAMINFSASADKSQAGEELTQFAWEIQQLIPELNTNYEHRNYTYQEGFTEYMVYEWSAKEKIPVTDIKGVSWKASNGTYEFMLELDRLFDLQEIDESERDEVVMKIELTMPKAIYIANTPYVEGDTAEWSITKDLLARNDTILKAVTE